MNICISSQLSGFSHLLNVVFVFISQVYYCVLLCCILEIISYILCFILTIGYFLLESLRSSDSSNSWCNRVGVIDPNPVMYSSGIFLQCRKLDLYKHVYYNRIIQLHDTFLPFLVHTFILVKCSES